MFNSSYFIGKFTKLFSISIRKPNGNSEKIIACGCQMKTSSLLIHEVMIPLKWIHMSKIVSKFEKKLLETTNRNLVNAFLVYKLDTWSRDLNTTFTLGDCLFWVFKLTKNADSHKYGYITYVTGLNACSRSLFHWWLVNKVKMLLFWQQFISA